jgi:hypothetical protein
MTSVRVTFESVIANRGDRQGAARHAQFRPKFQDGLELWKWMLQLESRCRPRIARPALDRLPATPATRAVLPPTADAKAFCPESTVPLLHLLV